MLNKKRQAQKLSKKTPKVKENNFKNFKFNKKDKKDEEILSESDNEASSLNDQDIDNPDQETHESADAKRLRMAKNLIKQIGKENDEDINDFIDSELNKKSSTFVNEIADKITPKHAFFSKGHRGVITDMDLCPSTSSKLCSVSKDCRVILWDLNTQKKTLLLPQFTQKSLFACSFVNENVIVVGGKDKHLHQVDLRDPGHVFHSFKAHNDTITGIKYDDNKEQFYTCSKDKTMKVWSLASNGKCLPIETFWGHTNNIFDIDVLEPNKVVTTGLDRQVHLWKVDTQSFLQFRSNSTSDLVSNDCIAALNPHTFITGSFEGNLDVWVTSKKKPAFCLQNSHGLKKEFSFSKKVGKIEGWGGVDTENIETSSTSTNLTDDLVREAFPITALAAFKRTDLITSGSTSNVVNFYKFQNKDKRISKIHSLELPQMGFVSKLVCSPNHDFLIASIGNESRLGRWDTTEKSIKTGINLIRLNSNNE